MLAQLAALQQGDAEGVFRFASPENQAATGPVERFQGMLQVRCRCPALLWAAAPRVMTRAAGPTRHVCLQLVVVENFTSAVLLCVMPHGNCCPAPVCLQSPGYRPLLQHEAAEVLRTVQMQPNFTLCIVGVCVWGGGGGGGVLRSGWPQLSALSPCSQHPRTSFLPTCPA